MAFLIFTLIIGGIYGALNIAKINYDTNLVSLNLQRQVRQGMSQLVREIRQAYLISITDKDLNRNSITFNRPGEDNITYSLIAGQLRRSPGGQVIANDIAGLYFAPLSFNSSANEYIPLQKITLVASKTVHSRLLTFSLIEQVRVRNQ